MPRSPCLQTVPCTHRPRAGWLPIKSSPDGPLGRRPSLSQHDHSEASGSGLTSPPEVPSPFWPGPPGAPGTPWPLPEPLGSHATLCSPLIPFPRWANHLGFLRPHSFPPCPLPLSSARHQTFTTQLQGCAGGIPAPHHGACGQQAGELAQMPRSITFWWSEWGLQRRPHPLRLSTDLLLTW